MNDFDGPEHEGQCTPGVGGAGENPFKYQGPYQLDPNSPKVRSGWEHRDTLSVDEFVYLYCGIDENKVLEDWHQADAEVRPYLESLRKVISEQLIAKPSTPEVDSDVPF